MDLQAQITPISEINAAHESGIQNLMDAVKNLECSMIVKALDKTDGNKRKAAQLLGVTERIFGYKVKQYHLKK